VVLILLCKTYDLLDSLQFYFLRGLLEEINQPPSDALFGVMGGVRGRGREKARENFIQLLSAFCFSGRVI